MRFSVVHMPLVRTPMIEPTAAYEGLPALSPEQAGGLIGEALRTRAEYVGPRIGTASEVLSALFPTGANEVLHALYKGVPEPLSRRSAPSRPPRASTSAAARQAASSTSRCVTARTVRSANASTRTPWAPARRTTSAASGAPVAQVEDDDVRLQPVEVDLDRLATARGARR